MLCTAWFVDVLVCQFGNDCFGKVPSTKQIVFVQRVLEAQMNSAASHYLQIYSLFCVCVTVSRIKQNSLGSLKKHTK